MMTETHYDDGSTLIEILPCLKTGCNTIITGFWYTKILTCNMIRFRLKFISYLSSKR